ncbi:MAG: hypothetical protein CME19_24275 [Gemmatimonadetes bacterium]|mgnify:CR=1 FL=1|nr:hypothetical protein [Gemmatimonadota bacterium]
MALDRFGGPVVTLFLSSIWLTGVVPGPTSAQTGIGEIAHSKASWFAVSPSLSAPLRAFPIFHRVTSSVFRFLSPPDLEMM